MIKKAIQEGNLQAIQRNLASGTCLYLAGQPTDYFYMLEEGSVLMSFPGFKSDTRVKQGHMLGLKDLMQQRYSHSAILDEESKVLEIPKEELLKAIETIASLRLYLIREISQQPNPAYLAYE